MGASEPQPVNTNIKKEQLRNSHPSLQKAYIVREPTKNYIQTSFPMEEKYYQQWRKQVEHTANDQYTFLPTEMGYTPSGEMCSKHGNVLANYPNYPYILSDEITRRRPNLQYFKEKQLYYLLYALAAAKMDARQRGQPLGDIKPQNVFFSRDEKIKVGSVHSFPYQKNSYSKLLDTSKPASNLLVAPEDLVSASSKLLDNKTNSKSEQFAIGATVLSAGILDDLHSLYNYSGRKFDIQLHRQKTIEWVDHPNYSQMLKSIVLTLVHPEVERRISIDELWAFLAKHEKEILSKQQFVVNTLPQRLEQGVAVIRSKINP